MPPTSKASDSCPGTTPKRSCRNGATSANSENCADMWHTDMATDQAAAGWRNTWPKLASEMPGAARRSLTSAAIVSAVSRLSAASPKNIVRQPSRAPSQDVSGSPSTLASVMPPNTTASAWPWRSGGTRPAPRPEATGPTAAAPSAISTRAATTPA